MRGKLFRETLVIATILPHISYTLSNGTTVLADEAMSKTIVLEALSNNSDNKKQEQNIIDISVLKQIDIGQKFEIVSEVSKGDTVVRMVLNSNDQGVLAVQHLAGLDIKGDAETGIITLSGNPKNKLMDIQDTPSVRSSGESQLLRVDMQDLRVINPNEQTTYTDSTFANGSIYGEARGELTNGLVNDRLIQGELDKEEEVNDDDAPSGIPLVNNDGSPTAITASGSLLAGEVVTSLGDMTGISLNDPSDVIVATLGTTDPDTLDAHTYTIISDPSGWFELRNDNELTVRSGANVNFETAASVGVVIRTEDSTGNTFDDTITVTIGDAEGSFTGTASNEVIVASSEEDVIDGNGGADTVNYANSTVGVNINLSSNINTGGYAEGDDISDIENIVGTDYEDNIIGDTTDNNLFGGLGNDTLDGGDGNDSLDGFASNDILIGGIGNDTLDGGAGNDTLNGGAGNDSIFGRNGHDIINAGDDNDTVRGGTGNDSIDGGDGDDLIEGGIGNNNLTGGSGLDRFLFVQEANASDLITDFSLTDDVIDVTDASFASFDTIDDLNILSDGGGNALVDLGAGHTVVLQGVDYTTLTHDHFDGVENAAPVLNAALGDQVSVQSSPFSYQFAVNSFTDIDFGDVISYGATLVGGGALPAWLTFDAITRTFSGTPPLTGSIDVRVTAQDGDGASITDDFTISTSAAFTVSNPNETTSYTEDVVFDPNDTTFASANPNVDVTLTLSDTSAGFLSVGTSGAVSSSYNPTTGEWTASGLIADVEAVLSQLRFVPTENYNLDVTIATEYISGADTITGSWDLTGIPINDAPFATTSLNSYVVQTGSTLPFTVPIDLFDDIDIGDSIVSFDAEYWDGSAWTATLPVGIVYDGNRNFSVDGTLAANNSSYLLRIVGEDTGGLTANEEFYVSIGNIFVGTSGDDDAILDGSAANEIFYALEGNDLVDDAGAGNDAVYGNDGNDTVYGQDGNDIVTGDDGNDIVTGDDGNDSLYGGTGNDTMDGGTGDDFIDGESGNDIIDTGTGNDTVLGGLGDDQITGLSGINLIDGGLGNDYITGGTGNSTLDGGGDNDTLESGEGGERLTGGAGADDFWFLNNTVSEFGEMDFVTDFSQGQDTLLVVGYDNISYSETAGTGSNLTYYFQSGNTILHHTDGFALTLIGEITLNNDDGDDGNDLIWGGTGNDSIDGGNGADRIWGGSGNDTLYGGDNSNSTGNREDTIFAGAGDDSITGGDRGYNLIYADDGDDTISFSGQRDTIYAGDGDDVLFKTGGYTTGGGYVDTGDGNDEITFTGTTQYITVITGEGNDTVNGDNSRGDVDLGAGDDEYNGGLSRATLYAGEGSDNINITSTFNTSVRGGDGDDDILVRGSYSTHLWGDAGDDIFVIDSAFYSGDRYGTSLRLTIRDLTSGEDIIDLRGSGYTGFVEGAAFGTTLGWGYHSYWGAELFQGVSQDDVTFGFYVSGNFASFDPNDFLFTDAANIGTAGDDIIVGIAEHGVRGLDGNDTLTGGDGGIYDIYGDDGDDDITVGNAIVSAFGGIGNDTISAVGQTGSYSLTGGDGDDLITGSDQDDFIHGDGDNDTIDGGIGNDTIYGGDGIDSIIGGTGSDSLRGGDNGDWIEGGDDSDTIVGDDGNDTLYGGAGNDLFGSGDGGDDLIYGEAGTDTHYRNGGNDTFHGGDDRDSYFDGDGDDLIYGDGGDDYIRTDLGNNTAYGGDGDDEFVHDNFFGTAGSAEWYGENGEDTFTLSLGSNTVEGGADNDRFNFFGGTNIATGGAGADEFNFSLTSMSILNIFDNKTVAFDHEITDFDDGVDSILLNGFGYTAIGLAPAKDDVLSMSYDGVNDWTLITDEFGDFTFKITGDVTGTLDNTDFDFAPVQGNYTGTSGDDVTFGNVNLRGYHLGDGNDTITDVPVGYVYGGDGNDFITLNHSNANSAWVNAGDGNDTILGGDSTSSNNARYEILHGGAGDDVIDGRGQADIIHGGMGEDTLTGGNYDGGAGVFTVAQDVFRFDNVAESQFGTADLITDLTNGHTIDLSRIGLFTDIIEFETFSYSIGDDETLLHDTDTGFAIRFSGDVTGLLDNTFFEF